MTLFDIIVSEKELNPNFLRIKDDAYKVKVLNDWASDEILDRDGKTKFIKEFQTTFNTAFWELYCYNAFKKMGAKFNFEHEYPDFVIEMDKEELVIECTIANNAQNTPMESDNFERFKETLSIDEIVHNQTIRLSNAFNKKVNKYRDSYCKEEWVKDKPFIIAIEPFDQPNFMITGNEAIRALLYGWKLERESHDEFYINELMKSEKAPLSMGLLRRPEYSDISGVFFSNTATMGKVDAMGDSPNLTFGQLRYNLNYDRPKVCFDSRLKQDKHDNRCDAVRESCILPDDAYKQYTIRRPLLQWGTNYTEDIVDGLILFLNPYAKKPINPNTIKLMKASGVNIVSYNTEKDEDIWEVHDGSLIQRLVFNVVKRY